MNVLIVESPSKAKCINKYLGSGFKVLASVGHVRDLSAKNDAIDTENDFQMQWETSDRGKKVIKEITDAAKKSENLYLATDPDREGEAIAWHVEKLLRDNASLSKLNIHRVTFNEITKNAVLESLKEPRQIDMELVDAYLARRALDYLVGFTLSPVLWRKLPGSKSAGRVQSVCLRLIVEREMEIEAFRAQEYWSVRGGLVTPRGQGFEARLTHFGGKKLDKFDLATQSSTQMAVSAVASRALTVSSVEA